MKTELLQADRTGILRAAEFLRAGGLVGIPTETVYGLAANALDGKAVAKIFAAKGRPVDNPLIVHISAWEQMLPLVREVPESAKKLTQAYWPGPLTIILPKADCIPSEVSPGLDTVSIRLPAHPIAREIISAAGVPLAAPSANLSGSPSPTCARHVMDDMDGRIEAVVDGGDCGVGLESTVITLATPVPRLLRPGGITHAQLEAVLGKVEIDPAVTHQLQEGVKAASPGMKYKHYAPKARVILLRGGREEYLSYVNARAEEGVFALCFREDLEGLQVPTICYGSVDDSEEQAHRLFSLLRDLDEKGARLVYAHCPSTDGVGLAVYNRLIRAAAFEIVEL
jgi:L-threonylcarbamoyladenylate synthase